MVLVGVLTPAGAPTIAALTGAAEHRSAFSVRVGPASLVELGALVVGAGWLVRAVLAPRTPFVPSRFDAGVLAAVALVGALQAVALLRGLPAPDFLAFDAERVLLPVAGYLLASRLGPDTLTWRVAEGAVAAALVLTATWLVLRHAVLGGGTGFGTAQGREALLITEDSLLLIVPAVLAWGRLVDGGLARRRWAPVLLGVAAVLVVDALSLRRGALLLIAAALLARAAWMDPRRALGIGTAAAVAVALLVAAGPLAGPWKDARYAAASAIGLREDTSTRQRADELRDLAGNLGPVDWVVGRGAGTPWRSTGAGPVEPASFGSGETVTRRIGWHAYGADWTYKFGLLGALALAFLLLRAMRVALREARGLDRPDRADVRSLALALPPLVLLTLTNPRVGFVAGVVLGLLSCAPQSRARTSPS